MKKTILLLIILASFYFFQCEDQIVSECQLCSDIPMTKTTFSQIQSDVFNPLCVSCHSDNAPSGGLNLSESVSYGQLVNVDSKTSPFKRVVPNRSLESYLVLVLEGEEAPLMPPSGKLQTTTIDSVRAWIDRGAAND